MFQTITLISCLIGVAISSGCGQNGCGSSGSSGSSDSSFDDEYDLIPLPNNVGKVGILDSPFYDCKTRNLYFVDLFGTQIFRYSEKSEKFYWATIPGTITPSFLLPVHNKPDTFVLGANNSVYTIQWDGRSNTVTILRTLTSVETSASHTNHGIAGPKGSLYFGTLGLSLCGGSASNGLYRWTKKSGTEKLPGSYKTTNSLEFDYKRNCLYHLDGCTQTLRRFKVNPKTGKTSNPIILRNGFGIPNSAAPVGLSIDTSGNLIIGSYKGSGDLWHINSKNGKIIDHIQLPTKYLSANTFGGTCDNLDRLYVLTAELDANVQTGLPISTSLPSPAGSLIVLYGPKGTRDRKPCIGC